MSKKFGGNTYQLKLVVTPNETVNFFLDKNGQIMQQNNLIQEEFEFLQEELKFAVEEFLPTLSLTAKDEVETEVRNHIADAIDDLTRAWHKCDEDAQVVLMEQIERLEQIREGFRQGSTPTAGN